MDAQVAKVGHQGVDVCIFLSAGGFSVDGGPDEGQRVFATRVGRRRLIWAMQCYRSLGRAGIGQPPLEFLYPELQGGDVADGQRRGLATRDDCQVAVRRHHHITYLLSFPRANWSLAAVHSFSRPALSQAVHAGSLLSHWPGCQSGSTRVSPFPGSVTLTLAERPMRRDVSVKTRTDFRAMLTYILNMQTRAGRL